MDKKFTATITAGLGGSDYVVKLIEPPAESGFGYKIDDPSAPGCLKAFHGKYTLIVPLANLVFFECNL